MRYAAVIAKSTGSYGAYVPDRPGCVAVGKPEDAIIQLIRETIEFHLDGLREDGSEIPPAAALAAFVDVAAQTSPPKHRRLSNRGR
ncbi:MAG: type II toxin-antitoxin system HicB family antitoxin [Gammaproteobacteria bacterium]|nr:type II toxin-antitoxin system HicB family antitoxin [Gammaproteobacteria bacterium]